MEDRKYLLIKGGAGLGDRITSVATGLLYARMTGRRPIVDWSDEYYSADGSNAFHRYYDCPEVGDLDELPVTDSVNPEAWRGRLDQRVHPTRIELGEPGKPASWRSLSVDLLRTDHPEELLVMWSYRQRIEWLRPHMKGDHAELARRSTRDILRGEMEANLRPSAEVAERVAAFRREHLQGPSVGVHVRYTDRLTRLDRSGAGSSACWPGRTA